MQRQLTVQQVTTLLTNHMAMTRPGPNGWWTGGELHNLMKEWGIRRSRRSAVLNKAVTNGHVHRERLPDLKWYRYRAGT